MQLGVERATIKRGKYMPRRDRLCVVEAKSALGQIFTEYDDCCGIGRLSVLIQWLKMNRVREGVSPFAPSLVGRGVWPIVPEDELDAARYIFVGSTSEADLPAIRQERRRH